MGHNYIIHEHSALARFIQERSLTNPSSSMIGFIDEKSSHGAMVNDGQSRINKTKKFEEASQISDDSRNNHRMLARLLGWLAVNLSA